MMKFKTSFLLFFAFLPLLSFSQEVFGIYYPIEDEEKYVYSDILNVRKGPGIEYEVVDKLKLGEEVTISKEFKSFNNTDFYT